MLPGLLPSPVFSLSTVTATYAGTAISTSSSNPLTFAARAIGTASDDRYVLLVVMNDDGGTTKYGPSAVTIGGVACTKLVSTVEGINQACVSFWITSTPIPTGTTADVICTWVGTNAKARVNTYAVTGLGSLISYFSGNVDGAGGDTISGVPVPSGCAVIAATARNSGSETPGITTTGLTMTNDQNANASSIGTRSQHFNNTGADITGVSFKYAGSSSVPALACVVLHP